MTKPHDSTRSKYELADHALWLAEVGDLDAAEDAFLAAIKSDPRNLDLYLNLALVEERLGDIDRAAEFLCAILVRKPTHTAAALRLSRLLARYVVEDIGVLHPGALRAAMTAPGVAHQPVVDATFAWLLEFDPDLEDGIDKIEAGATNERDVGRAMVASRTSETLSASLLLDCLRTGILKSPPLERVLTGVRAAILLDCPLARFQDRGLADTALALVAQGWNNDHAWAETTAETDALAATAIDRAALLAGAPEAVWAFVRAAMYRPLETLFQPPLTAAEAKRLKPRSVREAFAAQIESLERRKAAAATIPALRPLADATSQRVAGQYEAAPYPRWQSLHVTSPGSIVRALQSYFSAEELRALQQPFEVLIAGCGTGQQALQSAAGYGPDARLLALDLSRASLGYASDMASRHRIGNVRFLQGDILDVPILGETFDVIECVGVLHHMADWRAGWRALLARLEPGGLMYVGLYSAESRKPLTALRDDPAYPGAGCSDAAARAFRRQLLLRAEGTPGADIPASSDFHALNAFRDLVLHESEVHVTLEEIAAFLDEHDLEFRGFTLEAPVLAAFAAAFPQSAKPGLLADWAAFERANPRTFDAMYRFWLRRRK